MLALVTQENVQSLIERVQAEYYEPQSRQGVDEGSVMISTPGEGLAPIDVEIVWREAVEEFNASGSEGTKFRAGVNALLDNISPRATPEAVWPVIVAAGKGTRSLASGLATPKPLAPILGTPAILHVLHNVRIAFGQTRKPIVIVSPETESQIRSLVKEDVTFVVQPQARTADAVLCTKNRCALAGPGYWGYATSYSTKYDATPLSSPHSFLLTIVSHNDCAPYALLRDERGRVQSARETHPKTADGLR